MVRKKVMVTFVVLLSFMLVAGNLYSKSYKKRKKAKKPMKVEKVAKITKIEPTVESLESVWKNRHKYLDLYVKFGKEQAKLPDDFEVLWRAARAVYYGGFFALPPKTDNDVKVPFFKYGVDAAAKAMKLNPKRVEGHYWYAAVYGGYGMSKGIRASLGGAPGMRDACTAAIKIDPKYHFAGPYRIRGRLYHKLPGFISFGDNDKAMEDLKKAVELGPESKLNYIYLAELLAAEESDEVALKKLMEAKNLPDVAGVKEEASYRKDIAKNEKEWK